MARKLQSIDVVYEKGKGEWVAESGGRTIARGSRKAPLVSKVGSSARKSGGRSLRIHTRNGQLQERRTYPRSADLRKSKG